MKPTPGKQYTTQTGDTLLKISSSAYGNPDKSTLITDVNQSQIKLTTSGVIPTGTVLIIPIDNELSQLRQAQLNNGLK